MQTKHHAAKPPASAAQLAQVKWWMLASLLLVALVGIYLFWPGANAEADKAKADASTATAAAGDDWVNQAKDKALVPQFDKSGKPIVDPNSPQFKAQRIALVKKQLELAEHTYTSYKNSTKYPQESRPISEHPDQIYPNRPIDDEHAMRKANGQVDSEVKTHTTQSRVFVGAKEDVVFTVMAKDKSGARLPLFVTRAIARGLASKGQAPSASMQFADNGSAGDTAAGDGIYGGAIIPGNSSFANFSGTVRVEVQYSVNNSTGIVNFDFIYTPDQAASWAGAAREALENGALNFYLPMNVRQPGRYLVNGRVDDATGKPFALVTFNNLLQAGQHEVRLQVFGKLVVDQKPVFPLTLRDVDAYLLKEDTDPDRVMLPRLIGTVLTSKKYTLNGFSDAEWDSEQRQRYLQEYASDLEKAKQELNGLQ